MVAILINIIGQLFFLCYSSFSLNTTEWACVLQFKLSSVLKVFPLYLSHTFTNFYVATIIRNLCY